MQKSKAQKLQELSEKLRSYESKLAKKRLGYGKTVRTRYGDPYEEQLTADTDLLEGMIRTIKEEIKSITKS